jgi:hypothetical protein
MLGAQGMLRALGTRQKSFIRLKLSFAKWHLNCLILPISTHFIYILIYVLFPGKPSDNRPATNDTQVFDALLSSFRTVEQEEQEGGRLAYLSPLSKKLVPGALLDKPGGADNRTRVAAGLNAPEGDP